MSDPSAPPTGPGLRRDSLGFPEVFAQSVANVAPTATPTMNAPAVFASAGSGTWLAYLIATIGMVLVGLNINQFARRSASPGSLFNYVEKGLGPAAGGLCGWALAIAYLLTASASLIAFAEYGSVLFRLAHLSLPPVALFAIPAVGSWYLTYKDIRLSAGMMLVMEIASIFVILVLGGIIVVRHGSVMDLSQFALGASDWKGIRLGLVLAVFSFVGFESATTLGDEAKHPLRTIPRAVLSSTIMAGVFFIVISYIEVMGFGNAPTSFGKSDAPLNYLAEAAGVGGYGLLISAGAAISFFACSLASVTAGARVAYALAHPGVLHPAIGRTHPRNETPHVAVTLVALGGFLIPAALSLLHLKLLDIFTYTGTVATYGFVLVYLLICVAAPAYLRRERALGAGDVGLAVFSGAFVLWMTIGSISAATEFPANILPYLFLMVLAVGGVWLWLLKGHSPAPATLATAGPESEALEERAGETVRR